MSDDTRNLIPASDPAGPEPGQSGGAAEGDVSILELRGESHTGPLPHPRTLAEYDQWAPGTGTAIVDNWLEESKVRRQILRMTEVRLPMMGQVMGFIVVVGALALGGYAVHLGQSLVGFGVVFTALASVAGAWLVGRRS